MQSECMAASPQFISSYAWKLPLERPAIFERASKLISETGDHDHSSAGAEGAVHPSIPWKAYLASREFQHLASDLAEAIFNAQPRPGFDGAARPASLVLDAPLPPKEQAGSRRGLLASVLTPEAAASQETPSRDTAGNNPKAA
jgi:hypothetical protein